MSPSPRLALAAAVLLASAACSGGSGGGNTDGGTDGGSNGQTDQAYFGLTDGTCYGFLQAGGTAGRPPDATIGIQADHTLGYPALRMDYRVGGFVLRTDFVTVDKGQVLLHRREETGNPGMQVEFSPPIVLLERPVRETGTSPITTDSTSTDVTSGSTASWQVEVTVAATQSTQTTEQSAPFDASPVYLAYTHPSLGAATQDKLWVVPGTGFVRADLDGSSWPDVTLSAIWQLKQGESRCTAP